MTEQILTIGRKEKVYFCQKPRRCHANVNAIIYLGNQYEFSVFSTWTCQIFSVEQRLAICLILKPFTSNIYSSLLMCTMD